MSQSVATTCERIFRDETLDAYQRGVERAIKVMHERLGDELSIDDLAHAAFMSRYHFTRVFSMITGVSPGRFLTAIRMQEAKRLLLKTERSVTDISLDVGYNSLGTFTRIFADFVGFPPVRFRQFSRLLLRLPVDEVTRHLPLNRTLPDEVSISGEVLGDNRIVLVTVAVFPSAIPRSHPIECVCLTVSRRFSISRTPPYGARIFAAGLLPTATMEDAILVSHEHVPVGKVHPPKHFTRDTILIELSPRRAVEPPVVVAFPLLIAELLMNQVVSTPGEAPTNTLG